MKTKRQHALTHIPTPFTLILVLLLVALCVTPAATAGAAPTSREMTRANGLNAEAALPDGLSADEWATVQELIDAAQYHFTWQVHDGAWAYRAPNRAHDLSLAFAPDGLTATRYGAGGERLWDVGLALVGYGDQVLPAAIDSANMSSQRTQVEYRWHTGANGRWPLTEWYENSPTGVKHGLTLAAPPPGGKVVLTFALSGSLSPQLNEAGQVLRLRDASGATALLYDQLVVYDASGRQLPASLSLSPSHLSISIDDSNATYPLTVDPLIHSERAVLRASDAQTGDEFGYAVAVGGDTVVVGASWENGGAGDPLNAAGAAYVFERNQGGADNWGEVTILRASDAQAWDSFGYSVAVSGDTVVVGARNEDGGLGDPLNKAGAAYVFARNQGGPDNWGEVTILRASDAQASDLFGYSVATSGDTVVVGAYGEDGGPGDPLDWSGAAYIFARNRGGPDNWGEVTILHASDAQATDLFGYSMAISGDTVVVGAPWEDGGPGDLLTSAGAAYVFARNQGGPDNWGEVALLRAADGQAGDEFGYSVSISGDIVVVGALYEDGGPGDPLDWSGAAYVFARNQGGADSWGQVTVLRASDAQEGDSFGYSVAVSGDTVVVGAVGEDGGLGDLLENAGAAYVFGRNQGGADNWGQVTILRASDAQATDYFGRSVAISGDTIVGGADGEDGGPGDPLSAGAAYVFAAGGGTWQEATIARASDAQEYDYFGYSVAISSDTVVVGAYAEDGGAGDPLGNAGAAYVFARNQGGADSWGEVTILRASDAQAGDFFGYSVAISGDTVVVGAYHEDGGPGDPLPDAGAAYVFARNQGGPDNWGQVKVLRASDAQADDYFGTSVAVSGDTVVVGAYFEDGGPGDPLSAAGAAYVFARNQGGADNWGQAAVLRASDAQADDYFGTSVAVSGDTAVVGAYFEDGGPGDPLSAAGAAYVFARNQGGADNWGEVTVLRASDAQVSDRFGYAVATNGDTVVVGAYFEDGGPGDPLSYAGAAYVFARNQGGADSWGEVTVLRASDAQAGDYFGYSVAISGDTIVVGAPYENGGSGNPLSAAGAAYVFARNQGGADNWGQVTVLRASDAQAGDWFGWSVSISCDTVVAAAPYENGGPGGPLSDAGAAYVFALKPYTAYLPLVMRQ